MSQGTLDRTTGYHPLPTQRDGTRTETTRPHRGATGRLTWVDTARAFAVILVVLMHVSAYQYEELTRMYGSLGHDLWSATNRVLALIRMPTLLILSGWLAASRIREGWGSPRLRRSVVTNGYLYAVWFAVYLVVGLVLSTEINQTVTFDSTLALQFVRPDTTLWFLAALTVYLAVFATTSRLPQVPLLVLTVVLGWLADLQLASNPEMWSKVPGYAAFFLAGAVGARWWPKIVATPLLPAAAGLLFLSLLRVRQDGTPIGYPVMLALGFLGVIALAGALSFAVARWETLGRIGGHIGRNTLPIYVLHFPFVMLLVAGIGPLDAVTHAVMSTETGRWLYLPVMTAIIVAASLGIRTMCRGTRLDVLFRLPESR